MNPFRSLMNLSELKDARDACLDGLTSNRDVNWLLIAGHRVGSRREHQEVLPEQRKDRGARLTLGCGVFGLT